MTNENIEYDFEEVNGVEYYLSLHQNTPEWLGLKHGVLSASTFKNIITPSKLELSKAKDTVLFYDEILGQRIDPFVESGFDDYNMRRGHEDEPYAADQYADEYGGDVKHCGFVINKALGFKLGFSPDRLVGKDGFIEIKSKNRNRQVKTILDHVCGRLPDEIIPNEHMMQVQAGLFVTERKWCDFISFCNGNQMATIRVEPIEKYQDAIKKAAIHFEEVLQGNMALYLKAVKNDPRLSLTERREMEIT